MSKSFSLGQLTEGIRDRHVGAEQNRLMSKWTKTGLLRGLNENKRENMARLLENQAAQVLREANTLGQSGGVDGFTNIAFPIVRRVFGGLVANELVSIQPMSLPSGLLFYLDYSYGSQVGTEDSGISSGQGNLTASGADAAVYNTGQSLYGNPAGRSIRTGASAVGGMYDLAGTSYSKVYVTSSYEDSLSGTPGTDNLQGADTTTDDNIGAYNAAGTWTSLAQIETTNNKNLKLIQYDSQIIKNINEGTHRFHFFLSDVSKLGRLDRSQVKGAGLIHASGTGFGNNPDSFCSGDGITDVDGNEYQDGLKILNIRRLNLLGTWDHALNSFNIDATGNDLLMVVGNTDGNAVTFTSDFKDDTGQGQYILTYPKLDSFSVNNTADGNEGSTLVIPSFESNFASDPDPIIPEIDIKIESIAVTAQTRKLRARWSPELAQDLNAYHSLDAEVELTQILSEQIALEIDREILNDLLVEAKGANYYWSRSPGKFVKKDTGALASATLGPAFHGTVREWYETLVETIIDVANEIHRKTLRGSANFIVVSPDVATIFEASVLYKPAIKIDGQGQVAAPFSIGAEQIGSLSNRFTVYKDPYFPRNKVLVGYKGGSYLESGYVYAPYVPLIVTPTIFAPEDFTPRKGVMTRYGKKMVRADFYGTVTCLDMDVI